MKLVLAVIHDEDSHSLMKDLTNQGFMATKLASTGGLLKTGNTTIFVGVEKAKVDSVINIIKKTCKTTKKMSMINSPVNNMAEGMLSYPVEVTVGGATVFVLDVDQYEKI